MIVFERLVSVDRMTASGAVYPGSNPGGATFLVIDIVKSGISIHFLKYKCLKTCEIIIKS